MIFWKLTKQLIKLTNVITWILICKALDCAALKC